MEKCTENVVGDTTWRKSIIFEQKWKPAPIKPLASIIK
jgi:hypothetical protein